MITLSQIRENPEQVIQRLAIKHIDAIATIHQILDLDDRKKTAQKKLDDNLSQSNAIAKEIGIIFKQGKAADADLLKEKSANLKNVAKELSSEFDRLKEELDALLVALPNVPHSSIKPGRTAEDNEIIRSSGEVFTKEAAPLPHWDLSARYDLIDFGLGSKITGAGFPVYKKQGARLQRALINFFLDQALAAGYQEIQPPYLVNEASAFGTGQLPDKDAQMYYVQLDDLYLIPTAEVPVTNLYRDQILKVDDLPVKNVAYSACFRREAGSYGKDVRGLNRLHQFDKVEIVQITRPEYSYRTLEEMVQYVTGLLEKLELPYRVVKLCGGDISFASAMTYDMEVFAAGQQKWLEVSSVSNFETFQSNRMKLRFKDETGKTALAHTLNGSALALPRIVAALLEDNQTAEGIRIPAALIPFTGFDFIK
ncbi:MAG: serine--tRNA ligase [Bacteroidetes bacterium]|nr:serine--tRNA ligase [Bacteroidota bacterium]